MSRVQFKNDNFYFAAKKQNDKKQQDQLQRAKQFQTTDPQRKKIEKAKKNDEKVKKQAQLKDEQIFKKNMLENSDDFDNLEFFSFSKKQPKKDQDLDNYSELKSLMQKKKSKKANQQNSNVNVVPSSQIQLQNPIKKQVQKNQALQFTNQKTHKATQKNNDDDEFDDLLEALKANQVKEPSDQKQQQSQNVFKSFFKPKSTLNIVEIDEKLKNENEKVNAKAKKQKPKSENQLEWQRRKQQKKMKQQLEKLEKGFSIQQKDEQQKEKQEKEKKAEGQKEKKGKKSDKKIKKANNYQRLDLKRKYKDRFVGGMRENQRKYQKNGVLKSKYRMAQSELQIQNGEVYNNYIHSLSKSFHVDVNIESSDQSQSQNENEVKKIINIPTVQESTEQRLTQLIQEMFGFEKFREGQYEVIKNILSNESTIFISETASGKSLTYIIASLILGTHSEGMSIVISPLIALMLDQLEHLPLELPAACISSLINYEQRDKILNLIKNGEVKLLFMTPEMLMTDILFHVKQFPSINFVCIDEAHCLSELSHNFRNSYIALSEIIKNHIEYKTPNSTPNILCLTATANTETVESLSKKLEIKKIIKSSSTLNKNLYITITRQIGLESKYNALVQYLQTKEIMKCQAVIIYCRAKYIIDKVFNYLNNSNIPATVFHGTLSNKEKTKIITDFKNRNIKIIISTTALGMGLDFEHLDCIVHFNMAKSLESFVQQIGRAGRRQRRAYCQLFLDESDFFMQRNYILADELENQSMRTIAKQIQSSVKSIKNKKLKQVSAKQKKKQETPQQKEEEMKRVIKKASMLIQEMQNEEKNSEQFEYLFQSEEEEQNSKNNPIQVEGSVFSSLYYIRSKELAQKTYLREESLLIILMKISELMNRELGKNEKDEVIKILPLSNEFLKLSFFKSNEKQLIESQNHGDFYKKLVDIIDNKTLKPQCKKVNGGYHIHLISKCNQLKMSPIQLMTKVYEISNEYVMKVEFINEVFVFSLNNSIAGSRSKHMQRLIEKLQNIAFHKSVINSVNEVQNTSMTKLEVFYSLAFNYSQITVHQLVKKNMIIDRNANIPTDNIMNQITKYFNTDLNSFYNYIAETQDELEREMFLPTESIDNSEINTVYEYVKLFFKHQYSNLRDFNNPKQVLKKKEAIVDEYKDGKIITRVFLGVNEEKSSRLIFGEHTYWRKFMKKKYFSLLKTVRQAIVKGREDLVNC